MFKPTTGDLLRGIRKGLEQSVLPELSSGGAQRQLKAALHVLRRLERSWNRLPSYLDAENRDIRNTLHEVFRCLAGRGNELQSDYSLLQQRLVSASGPTGEDTAVCASPSAEQNLGLQELLVDIDALLRLDSTLEVEIRRAALALLAALYGRMVDRELQAWATDSSGDTE